MAKRASAADKLDLKGSLDELEEEIEAVRHAYEKYFAGVDKTPPVRAREKLDRRFRLLQGARILSTQLRFRANGLRARFVTYKHYWTRVEMEIERGASRRDLLRVRRGFAPPPSKEGPRSQTASAEAQGDGSQQRTIAASQGPDIDPKHLREVFKELVRAKKAAGESTKGLTYAAMVRKLNREAPKLKARHKCASLRFEVSTEGGKVKLLSRPSG